MKVCPCAGIPYLDCVYKSLVRPAGAGVDMDWVSSVVCCARAVLVGWIELQWAWAKARVLVHSTPGFLDGTAAAESAEVAWFISG